ncbi:histidine kinase [Flavobacterium sp. LM5]|uniref:tetratricopeptide repeat-containing sensor histidine kinase n=1 Tax=Flavobacterium sp. LM5 TaxID=1938610 RepID=UPI000991A94B|nr:tetratricopeptide repeat-containing sensor histidine kinase [Flavobacterium sp. LM5]OOV26958.1 histidine kinase [Flavobacterium sp. LM5]
MIQLKQFIIFLLFLVPNVLLSQTELTNKVFISALKKKAIQYQDEIYFNKAKYFFLKKECDSTLVNTMKQLSFRKNKELNDYCHYLRALCLIEKEIYNEAKKELKLINKDFFFYPLVNIKMGSLYYRNNKLKTAIFYTEKAINESNLGQKGIKISSLYDHIGTYYIHLKSFKKAEEYLFKSLELQKKEEVSLFMIYTNIANLYYEQYKDAQAITYFEKAYFLPKEIKDFDNKRRASLNMAVVEENRGNFKQALIYRKEYGQWKDSLNNQNKVWAVADYEKKYAVAQKQKQISVLKVENELKNTQRNTMFFSTIGLLLLLTGGVYVYGQKVKNTKIILSQKEKLDELNATKDQLFSIVSHDLRSSVNALKTSNTKLTSSLESKNYDELDKLLHQNSAIANGAYSLLDNLLHWALLQTQQLYFHKDSVHLFSIVQQIEYSYKPLLLEKTIAFENEVSKNCFIFVDLDSLKIILRNLLDNAIKFSPENSSIRFYSLDTPSEFHQFIIEDQGIGMRPETIAELLEDNELLAKKSNSEIIGTGLGMQLCKQMIQKNGGTLAIESELNKGTKMILSFPKTV